MKSVQWKDVPMGELAWLNGRYVQKRFLPLTNILVTRAKATGGVYGMSLKDAVPVLVGNYQWVEVDDE